MKIAMIIIIGAKTIIRCREPQTETGNSQLAIKAIDKRDQQKKRS